MTTIQCSINAIAVGGAGVGKITSEGATKGKTIFVPFSIPGEVIEAEIVKDEKRFSNGKLLSLVTQSPHRVPPPCVYFASCGGCQLQHIAIAEQREYKRQLVETTLLTRTKLQPKKGVRLAGQDLPAYGYRNRVSFHLSPEGELGFYRAGTEEVVSVAHCLISNDAINGALPLLQSVASLLSAQIATIVVESSDEGAGISHTHLLLTPRKNASAVSKEALETLRTTAYFTSITERSDSGREKILWKKDAVEGNSVGHFSQVNEKGNELLIKLVTEAVSVTDKEVEVTELYSGAGNFSLPLAGLGYNVTAVELDDALITLGKRGLHLSKPTGRVKFVRAACEEYVKRNALSSTVVIDPPRTGAEGIIPALLSKQVKRIVYVSCSLPTLTRDLQLLSEGGFSCESVHVVDMFSQTHHVECVVVLTRA